MNKIHKIIKKGSLVGDSASNFISDAYRIQSGGFASIEYCTVTDTLATDEAHRDAFQLVPVNNTARGQLSAAHMRNVLLQNNTVYSSGHLQGIFSSDGLHSNLVIRNNKIDTQSHHKISINGLLSGWIEGNTDSEGNALRVDLWPLRIGGGGAGVKDGGLGCNVYVLDFADSMNYDDLQNITRDENVNDYRFSVFNRSDIFIREFRLKEFYKKAVDIYHENAQYHGYLLQVAAMGCGRVVYE